MTRWLQSMLSKIDAWPLRTLLVIHLCLASLIGIAHGGALLAFRAIPGPVGIDIERMASITLPFAGLIMISAVVALAAARFRRPVLAFHGVVFMAGALAEIVWGVDLLLYGIPAGNFAWTIGMFSVSVAYAACVFSRFGVPARFRAAPLVYYLPVLAVIIAIPIDIGVMVRFSRDLIGHFIG